MSSENFSNNLDHMFLDRDPTWFPLVLHFLRTGDALLPECTEERRAVFREAQYYSLHGLCQAARKRPERIIVIGERYDGDYEDGATWKLKCCSFPVAAVTIFNKCYSGSRAFKRARLACVAP